MGYCSPVWVSDYTFKGLFERMAAVAETKRPEPQPHVTTEEGAGSRVPTVRVRRDGTTQPGPLVRVSPSVSEDGAGLGVTYETEDGRTVGVGRAALRDIDGTGGGLLVLRDAPASAARVRVGANAPVTLVRR
jgi:hypothetical protein